MTVYSSLDCTSVCHHTALSPEAQKRSAFTIPIRMYKLNKVPFGLAQAVIHFQLLINERLKDLSFVSGYFDETLVFS